MNAVIEVAAMTAGAEVVPVRIRAVFTFVQKVSRLVSQTAATSVLRVLRQGKSSLCAVPGDLNFNLGGDYALA